MKVLGTGSQTSLTEATALKSAATTTPLGQATDAATSAASVQISPEAHLAYIKSQHNTVSGTWHAPGRRYAPASPAAPTSKTPMPTDPTGTGSIKTPGIPTLMPTDPTGTGSLKTPTGPTLMPTDPTGRGPGLDISSSQPLTLGATLKATVASTTQDYPTLMPGDPTGTGSFGAPPTNK